MSNGSSDKLQSSSVPWNPWWATFFVVAVYFGSQIIGSVPILLYAWSKHWQHAQATAWLDNSVGAQFVYILVAEACAIAAVYVFVRLAKSGLASIGLRRPQWWDVLYGLYAVPFYYILYLATVVVAGHFITGLNVDQQQQIGFNNVHGNWQLLMTFASLVILPPLAEEIMVRGFLYSSLKKAMPTIWAVLATSAIFAGAHLPEGGAAGPLYIAALDTFVLSLVLIYLREKTGGLWASITLHAIKNGIAFMALFVLHVR